ncbi:SusC/RagA family TonB-linked outer membrane protein [Flammeovirgaceae bacterium SG7u.111]|nr:SusC/RagA family TonB-linked outer membrane protein [Flammeovirgaceae bacterium SG7u.132]WPO34064.1 SusC/RagA family TonB-linked outer membrane protein [Flammeovirgaceae bacterium SG7u.111]
MKQVLLCCLLMLCGMSTVFAQGRSVSGQVISGDDNTPLPGVNVIIKGTSNGTVTDIDGKFRLQVPSDNSILVFSYIGFQQTEITVGASSTIDVSMKIDNEVLQEVVVNALGFEVEKSKSGSSFSQVDGGKLINSGEPNLLNSIAGKASGVNIVQNSGDPGAGSRIVVRGATSITGNIQPLIVIDGIPVNNETHFGEGWGGANSNSGSVGSGGGVTQQSRLNDINPNDIESMEILKGASAAALWGARAANGVIVITTKKGKSNGGKPFSIQLNSSVSLDQINKKIPLNETYGQGYSMMFNESSGYFQRFSWGDRIADRPGGEDERITDPNADGYIGYFESANGNRIYRVPDGTATDLNGGKNSRYTGDPQDYLFKTGVAFNNSISLSSGDDRGNIYFSLSNINQNGIIKENSTYERTTARINATRYIGKSVTVSASAAYSNTMSDRIQMGSNLSGLFLGGLRTPSDFDPSDYIGTYTDADGNQFPNAQRHFRNPWGSKFVTGANGELYSSAIYDNPLWMMNNITSTASVDRFIGKLELGVNPFEWLDLTARWGIDTYTDGREDYFPAISAGENSGGRYTKETINERQMNLDLIANMQHRFSDNFEITGLIGTSLNQRVFDDHGLTILSFTNPDSPPVLNNASSGNYQGLSRFEEIRSQSVYGSATVGLLSQVYITGSLRADAFSTLPEQDNVFLFGAVDVAWQFHELIPQNNILTFGKVRGSYGQVGRSPDPYITTTDIIIPDPAFRGYGEGWGGAIDPASYGGGVARSNVAGNPTIEPEIKTETEVGLDLQFFKNKFSLTANAYTNKVDNAIIQVDQPPATGFVSQVANAATIENKGVELEASLQLIDKGDFNWTAYANWTKNRNEVTDMAGVESISLGGFSGTSSRAVLNQQLGVLWGATFERDDNGAYVLDEQGFPTQSNTPGVIGDPNPDWRGGLGTRVGWKNFSLNVLFETSQGGDMWNGTLGALTWFGRAGFTTNTVTLSEAEANNLEVYGGSTVADYYPHVQNGDGSYTVRGEVKDFGGGDVLLDENWYVDGLGSSFTGPDESSVEDASWTRLRELTLAYTFNSAAFRSKTKLQNVTLSFTGRNLALWTDYSGVDPDTNLTGGGRNAIGLDYFNNPATRSFIFKLSATY